MKTRITELLGIKYPIIQAAMAMVANVRLVVAVSEAGGLGILAGVGKSPEELRRNIREIREQTSKPFAVNLVAIDPLHEELGEVVVEEKVPVISHGLGNPGWLIKATQAYGAISMPTVGAVRHAMQAEKDGAKAIVVQGLESGGHTSHVATMVLLPAVVDSVKVPVIAAGGFCDGRGLAAALALGAEGIYMGTRFAITQESPISQAAKELYLRSTEEDTTITYRISGGRLRCINNELVQLVQTKRQNVPWRQVVANFGAMRRDLHAPWWKVLLTGWKMKREHQIPLKEMGNLTAVLSRMRLGLLQGDPELGALPSGQVCGRLKDIPTCQELIEWIVAEAKEQLKIMEEKLLS